MSLINDMLNDLEKNKNKSNQANAIHSQVSADASSTAKKLPPADLDASTMSPSPSATTLEKPISDSKQPYRQPWETQTATKSADHTMDSPSILSGSTVLQGHKPSQKRLIIWVIIASIACAVLAFLYAFPKENKTQTTPLIVATPSEPIAQTQSTPVIDIHQDTSASQGPTALNNTPQDSSSEPPAPSTASTADHEKMTTPTEMPKIADTTHTSPEGAIEVTPAIVTPTMQAQNSYDQVMSNLANLSSAQAIEQLSQITNQFPTFEQARLALAAMLIKYGQNDQALAVLEDGLKQDPSNFQIAELAAHVLVESNHIDKALALLKTAQPATIQASPDYYAMMAGLYLQDKNYKQASLFYQALTNLNPQNGTWWAGLAISLDKQGQTQAAVNAYNQAETVGGLSPALQSYIDQIMQGS